MSTRTEVENIKTSATEKVLAAVLTIFILIGAIWLYEQIGKISEDEGFYRAPVSVEDREALSEAARARGAVWQAEGKLRRAREAVQFTGDTYRTEIDAGLSGENQLAAYRISQQRLADARKSLSRARSEQRLTEPAAEIARENQAASRESSLKDQNRKETWVTILRLALVAVMLGLGYWWLSVVRRRRSRTLPLALAEISAAALLALFMAGDYGSDIGLFEDIGPLAISVIGILLTVLAFVALQRYLARLIPARRVRREECPFCGYPGHGKRHCEGCGRRIVGECATCHEPRRVSTPHCGNCGAT